MKSVIYCSIVIIGALGGLVAAAGPDPACFKLPGNKDPKQCCNSPSLISEDVFTKCMSENQMPSMPPPGGKMRGCCVSECVLNTTGINVNGVPNQEKAIEFLQGAVGRSDAEFMTVIRKAIDECTQMMASKEAEFKANMATPMAGEKMCNPQSGFLLGCVHGNIFKNCPESKWTSDNDCNAMKQHVEKCMFLIPFKKG